MHNVAISKQIPSIETGIDLIEQIVPSPPDTRFVNGVGPRLIDTPFLFMPWLMRFNYWILEAIWLLKQDDWFNAILAVDKTAQPFSSKYRLWWVTNRRSPEMWSSWITRAMYRGESITDHWSDDKSRGIGAIKWESKVEYKYQFRLSQVATYLGWIGHRPRRSVQIRHSEGCMKKLDLASNRSLRGREGISTSRQR